MVKSIKPSKKTGKQSRKVAEMTVLRYFCNMNENQKSYLPLIQVVLWGIIYIFLLLYSMHKWDMWYVGAIAATINCIFYLSAMYLQTSWLAKKYLKKGVYFKYITLSVAMLLLTTFLRLLITHPLFFIYFTQNPFYHIANASNISFVFITQFLATFFGFLLRIALNYITLLQNQEKLKVQQLQTELNLLKSQVQPHFLFNTLNNIYYLAHTKSETTKDMIAKLSEMMRYFLEEAPKEKVPLSTEIQFIKDYICLEKIRMPYAVQIDFGIQIQSESVLVPPMLLMPLVENVFKHGIDKAKNHNEAKLCLSISPQTKAAEKAQAMDVAILRFEVINDLQNIKYDKKGTGLENLRKRLCLLYGENYILEAGEKNRKFVAVLEINL